MTSFLIPGYVKSLVTSLMVLLIPGWPALFRSCLSLMTEVFCSGESCISMIARTSSGGGRYVSAFPTFLSIDATLGLVPCL